MVRKKFRQAINSFKLLRNGDSVIVGVSGGPDSVCLLYLLNAFKNELSLKLYAAHLDHMLRKDSHKDRRFVEALCVRLGVPLFSEAIDVKGLSRGLSTEEAARNARFDFFFKTAKKAGAKKIALGHNFDDQAETVLMRLIRGAGLYGLTGMLPKRNINGFCVIRPLIGIKRSEIELFLKKRKLRPRIDASNKEEIYFRNKIRNKLLPLLQKGYNRNIKEVLAGLAQSSGRDYDYLIKTAQRQIKKNKGKLSIGQLKKMHPAIRRVTLRALIWRCQGDTRRITFRHITEIEDLIINRPFGSVVDLPKGLSAVKAKYLVFRRKNIQ